MEAHECSHGIYQETSVAPFCLVKYKTMVLFFKTFQPFLFQDNFGTGGPAIEEDILEGTVGLNVYRRYFANGSGWILLPAFVLLSIGFQVSTDTDC